MRFPLRLAACAALAALALPAPAESVRLRTGRTLHGEVASADDAGLQLRRWDNGGTVFLPWAVITSAESRRLRSALRPEDSAARPTVPGVRIVTDGGKIEEGLLVEETSEKVVLKAGARRPQIPAKSIRSRVAVDLDPERVYTPDELYDQKAKTADLATADGNLQMAEAALALRLPDKARAHYQKAAELDPARKEQIDRLLEDFDKRQKEAEARKLRADIAALAAAGKFDQVKDLLAKLRDAYAQTEAAQDLDAFSQKLQADEEQFKKNRDDFLRKKIAPEYLDAMARLVKRKAGDRKATLADAQSYADSTLQQEIKAALAGKFGLQDADVEKYWNERETAQTHSADYGTGTWIVLGGAAGPQGGGGRGGQGGGGRNTLDRLLGGNKKNQSQQPQPQQQKGWVLQTQEEWWTSSPGYVREEWLEAYFAEKAMKVVQKKERVCPVCGALGVLKRPTSQGIEEFPCSRCHGVKKDITIIYQ